MAALTTAQRLTVQYLIDYLVGAGNGPMDERVSERLSVVFGGGPCFSCLCGSNSVQDGLRDEATRTFLRMLLCVTSDQTSTLLTSAQRIVIRSLVNYLVGAGNGPIDNRVVEQLARIFESTECFDCECGADSVRGTLGNETSRTFLRMLLCVSPVGVPGPGEPGFIGPVLGPNFLLSACGYGILAASTITNTGFTVDTGDLGLSPGTSVTGFPPGIVQGTQHITDAAAAQAQLDLTAAYLELESRTGATAVAGNIGGQTLTPGLYKSTSSLAISSGNLTLDAQGNPDATFVFQIASTFTMTAARQVILAGGAQAKNIFWQVGNSATIGSTAILYGSILALTSITAVTNAVINGRLLARNGAVTLDDNDINVPSCD